MMAGKKKNLIGNKDNEKNSDQTLYMNQCLGQLNIHWVKRLP